MPINDLVQDVFIDPIKSVLFIDDNFPSYADLLESADPEDDLGEDFEDELDLEGDLASQALLHGDEKSAEPLNEDPSSFDRAYSLTSSCRQSGFIFDVESNPTNILNQSKDFINKPDLIVLDYILEPETRSEAKSLQILKVLDETERFNLVVLYTTKSPSEVAPVVARVLRGSISDGFSKAIEREAAKIDAQEIKDNLLGYFSLNNRSLGSLANSLGVKDKFAEEKRENIVRCAFESHLVETYDVISLPELNLSSNVSELECSSMEDGRKWIRGKNVFVAIVQKTEDNANDSIDGLVEELKECLKDYRPSPISLLMRKGITSFRSANADVLKNIFGDEKTRAALLYHTLESEHPSNTESKLEISHRVIDLTQRAFATFSESVHQTVGEFGEKLFSFINAGDESSIVKAKKHEKLSSELSDGSIILALNAFLCSTDYSGLFFTNGVVFKSVTGKKRFWVCASPSCDMFPRKKDSGYRQNLYPAAYFEALRLECVTKDDEVKQALADATQCNHIFLNYEGNPTPFRILHGAGENPHPYVFYSCNTGLLEDGKATLQMVTREKCKAGACRADLKFESIDVEVLGKLRSEYADRLLHSKGSYNSRIGVDFISYE